MTDPVMIVKSPEKPNLVYSVCEKHGGIKEAFIPLVEELQWKRTVVNKMIIFCRIMMIPVLSIFFFSEHVGTRSN